MLAVRLFFTAEKMIQLPNPGWTSALAARGQCKYDGDWFQLTPWHTMRPGNKARNAV